MKQNSKKKAKKFYSTYPVDVSEIENELNQRYEERKSICNGTEKMDI